MEIDDRTRQRIVLLLGVLVFLQAVMGAYLLYTGQGTMATTTFSTMAVLAASMAAVSAGGADGETDAVE